MEGTLYLARPLEAEPPSYPAGSSMLCLGLLVLAGFVPISSFDVTAPDVVIRTSIYIWGEAMEMLVTRWDVSPESSEIRLRQGGLLASQFLYLYACMEFIGRILMPHTGILRGRGPRGRFADWTRNVLSYVVFGLHVTMLWIFSDRQLWPEPGGWLLLLPYSALAWDALQQDRESLRHREYGGHRRTRAWYLDRATVQPRLPAG